MRRTFRKKNLETITTILLIIIILVVWLNFEFSRSLDKDWTFIDCQFPCFGVTCKSCRFWTRKNGPIVDIAKHLNLKNIQRSLISKNVSFNTFSSGRSDIQVCKHGSFKLEHDSVQYAFFHPEALNCTGTKLFYNDFPAFRLNSTNLNGQVLEKCLFYGINRLNDDFHTYTEPLVKEPGPFDLIFKQDFVHVKCFFKDDNDTETTGNATQHGDNIQSLMKASSNKTVDKRNNTHKSDMKVKAFETEDKIIHNEAVVEIKRYNIKVDYEKDNVHKLSNRTNKTRMKDHERSIHDKKHKNETNDRLLKRRNTDRAHVKDDVNKHNKHIKHKTDKNKLKGSITRKLLEDAGNAHEMEIPDNQENAGENDNTMNYEDYRRDYFYDPFMDYGMETADFEQFLVQVYPKFPVFQRIDERMKYRRPQRYMDVMMIGLDSMSHLSFQRKLPITYKYLKDELKSVILDGYNIVGDATTAALIPMLTGKFETELPEVRKNQFESEDVDVYPLIWKDFQKAGYVTMFAEDEPSIGVFNLRLNGFKTQPTDHYMRPFWQALWDSEIRRSSPRYCTGFKPNHEYLLDYLKDFYEKYSNVSKFSFIFGSELTHWDNNPGEYMDQDLTNLLKYFDKNKFLDNTLLIVMGDHGARYSRVRKTVQGKMEERLPMMSLRFPKWFQTKFSKLIRNLQSNVDKLTTPFDIYETLRDVLDLRRTKFPINHSSRAFSLLRRIPLNRTCTSSHIQMHWCTCLKQLDLDPHDKHVLKSAWTVIEFMNNKTEGVRDQCAELTIKQILHAQLLIPNEMVLMFQHSQDDDQRIANFSKNINVDHAHFQITMETGPNKGLYEATVQVNMTSDSYTVIDEVSRLNLYGNQPLCIQEKYPDLRKYCYCNNFVQT